MSRIRFAALAVLTIGLAACDDDDTSGPGFTPSYNQVQRLGNPLVSEVLLMKRDHATHGSIGPAQDATLTRPGVVAFLTDVAGRDPAYAATIADVLTPDVLVVHTERDAASAGWLSWALANGWGGRKLEDDVVDLALTAVFGSALGDEAHATPALTTDNVAFDSPPLATFPYVAAPN